MITQTLIATINKWNHRKVKVLSIVKNTNTGAKRKRAEWTKNLLNIHLMEG